MNGKKLFYGILFGLLSVGLITSTLPAAEVKTETVERVYVEEDYVKTADNFLVLYDASGSVGTTYKDTGRTKLELTKTVLKNQAESLPNLGFNSGIYVYTPWKVMYPAGAYDKNRFLSAANNLPATVGNEPTPLFQGIMALDPILARMSGKTVVFLVSDGQYTTGETVGSGGYSQAATGHPAEAAKEIASKYDVCFYIMSTATKAKDEETLRRIAAVNTCSRVVPIEQAAATKPCTASVLCTVKASERVVTYTKVVGMDVDRLHFGFDRSDIQMQYNNELDALGRFLQANPNAYAILRGYADSTGDEGYNMGLSRRRAESVAEYLLKNFSIGSERVITQWYGEANPAATNATSEGRAQNRRVEIDVAGVV